MGWHGLAWAGMGWQGLAWDGMKMLPRAFFFLSLPAGERCFRSISCEENETFSSSKHENEAPTV
jgi:hypothetical protein